MNISISEMAEKLKSYKEYRIVYHIRPDGDCIGSAFALAMGLQTIGAKCEVVGRDIVPFSHRYLTDKFRPDLLSSPAYISVDTASPERTGNYCSEHFTFCIDHHLNNSVDADYKYVEPDSGACSEIIFKLLKAMDVAISKEMADLLYLALVTDTMCFRTADTHSQSFETAAELVRYGADIYTIGRKHMFIKSPQRMKIEKILNDSFNFTCDNKVLTGIITLNDLKTADILDSELEGINSYVEQIDGIKIGVTIRELPDGRSRCSMRSNGNIAANEICAIHGGGGHLHAACCELDTNPVSAREIIENTCKKYLEQE